VDPIRIAGPITPPQRAQLIARCDQITEDIADIDRQIDLLVRRRREFDEELCGHRDRLYPVLTNRGRQPGRDGSVQLPPVPHGAVLLWGRRLRRLCVAFLSRLGPLALPELHAMLHRHRFAVAGDQPVKVLADALGYEVDTGGARRVKRGVYEALGAVPDKPLWRHGPRISQILGG
jgi:hypothetical protein